MEIGIIGLGRRGANIARRLMKQGHQCVVYNRSPDRVHQLETEGAFGATSIDDMITKLPKPAVVWIMVPAGAVTERAIADLTAVMDAGDIIIDGGNTYYKDDVSRAESLASQGIHYLDIGTCGGVWGLERGYCLMIGGETKVVQYLDPVFKALAPGMGDIPRTPGRNHLTGTAEAGYLHCGSVGAGHFVKMIHNGMEHALMQAYAEGFDILKNADSPKLPDQYRYRLNVADIAEVWRRGSIVSSWLLDLSAIALVENPELSNYTSGVQDSEEGRGTVMAAVEAAVPAEVLSASLQAHFRSRQQPTFAEKVLSAMRFKFGGHTEQK